MAIRPLGWYGTGVGPGHAEIAALRHLYPSNPRFQLATEGDRLIVSEPFSDLPGVWDEIPQATAAA